jgi:hypothetical protein
MAKTNYSQCYQQLLITSIKLAVYGYCVMQKRWICQFLNLSGNSTLIQQNMLTCQQQ